MLDPAVKDKYSVITLANNKTSYVKFALNCAQSIILFNDIKVYIITNLSFEIPPPFRNKVFILKAKAEHAALGIEGKLYLNEYLQTEHTFFIDSDCLCFSSLQPIFDACEGMHVSAVGRAVPLIDYWGDKTDTVASEFKIDKMPLFNGAFYYFKKTATTNNVFEQARKAAKKYDNYGLDRLKNNWKNEEELLAIGMAANGQNTIVDNGTFMTDLVTDQRPSVLNVLKGERLLKNPELPNTKHRASYPARYSPIILHFGGSNINSYPYISQRMLLKLERVAMPTWLSSLLVFILIHLPYKIYHRLRAWWKNNKML